MGKKFFLKGLLAAVLSLSIATIFGSSASYAEAVITRGLYTDSNDVRWEWQKTIDEDNTEEPEMVSIMFYDKPATATTIVVPSLSDVITAASATPTLDTYYVRSADQTSQDEYFTSETRRESTADVTVLDMTNTSKVQIMGVRPIINPETEAELIFGENMVIGDGEGELKASISLDAIANVCTHFSTRTYEGSSSVYYYCDETTEQRFTDLLNSPYEVTDWNYRAALRKTSIDSWDLGCRYDLTWQDSIYEGNFEDGACYVVGKGIKTVTRESINTGAFAGYKLKLTNLENVKYLGWYAFQHSTFNEESRAVVIKATQTAGEGVFAWTNVNEVTFEGNEVFPAMFKGCSDLTFEKIHFGNVETIGYDAFMDTNLGVVDLGETQVKNVLGFAFQNAGVSEVNLGNVEKLDMQAFAYNNITELDYPKSIKEMYFGVFIGNPGIEKITVRFDTYQTTLPYRLSSTVGCDRDTSDCEIKLKELHVIAPYEDDEPVSETHGKASCPTGSSYCSDEGAGRMLTFDGYFTAEFNPGNMKNVIAGSYFDGFSMEKLVVGEGYEYIGNNAFYTYKHQTSRHQILNEVILPETLKGIGAHAFENFFNAAAEEPEYAYGYAIKHKHIAFEFPKHLIAIGDKAFYNGVSLFAEFDLPDLEYIGTSAFENTNINDIVFHNKLVSVGMNSFYYYTYVGSVPGQNIREGKRNVVFDSQIALYYSGIDMYYYPARQAFGKIVFTENISYITVANQSEPNVFFYGATFDEIDMSESSITTIYPNAFNGIRAKKVSLPKNLKTIGSFAFYGVQIDEELVLPDTIESIDYDAFNAAWTNYHAGASPFYPELGIQHDNQTGIKITKLPESLKTVGKAAFFGDDKLTAEVNNANLEVIGMDAFHGTSITSVTLYPTLRRLEGGAFNACINLRDITIDADVLGNFRLASEILGSGYIANNNNYRFINNEDLHYDSFVVKGGSINAPATEASILARKACEFGEYSYSYCANEDGSEGEYRESLMELCEFGNYNYYRCANEDGSAGRWRGQLMYLTSFFYGANIDNIDLSEAGWSNLSKNIFNGYKGKTIKLPRTLERISDYAFYATEVEEPISMPSSITEVGQEAFQYANIRLTDAFSEGLKTIKQGAFYGAVIPSDITIPSTVESIGWGAFNAGNKDANYGVITIKPALNYDSTNGQAIFQIFWNSKMDKLIIDSPMLPVLAATGDNPVLPHEVKYQIMTGDGPEITSTTPTLREDGEPEFHGVTMKEVVITALPEITANAFEECAELEKVTFAEDVNLNRIDKYAFNNATKLKQVVFGEANNGHDINIEEYAFNNTAIESLGTTDASDFNLAAANFHTINEHVFSNMPKLKTVEIPNNFNIDESMANADKFVNGAHITSFTFADDPELESVVIGYQIAEIRDGAFLNDEKLAKMFIWGNAEIQESDDLIRDFDNTTIPRGTTIFAYSDAPAEQYANTESRDAYDGRFYALDEVLYLTTNRNYVVLNEDKDDFDKSDLKLYALRRDGVILESDNWQEYTTAFPRSTANINFEEGRGALGPDDATIAVTVFDAPKPFDVISLANENYANVDFEFLQMPSSINPLVLIHYPDGYTGNIRTATLTSMTKEEEEEYLKQLEELEVPNTGVFQTIASIAAPSVSIATIVVLGGIYVARKRKN